MTGKPTIAIDCGHGVNFDTGAEATVKGQLLKEEEVVLDVGRKLEALCKASGVKTIWCRPKSATSQNDSLCQRVSKSNDNNATIYISLHCNAFKLTDLPIGTEAYAISVPGKALARAILINLAEFGWKNRGVKTSLHTGSAPYVVQNTNAVALLLEICFIDSAVDRIILAQVGTQKIAQAIYDAIMGNTNAVTSAQLPSINNVSIRKDTFVEDAETVLDAIVKGKGSTTRVDGLSDQIIQAMGPTNLVRVTAPNFSAGENCDPYFQPQAAASLSRVLKAHPNLKLICNSAYRSCVRQFVLYEGYKRQLGYIKLAAAPGTGNHEDGCAVDVQNWQAWKPYLEAAGWDWQGSRDEVHFSYARSGSTSTQSIAAFQTLHNQYCVSEKLIVDGSFGSATRRAMLRAPGNGWGEVNTAVSVEFNRALKEGVCGADVVALAQRLRTLGFLVGSIEHNRFDSRLTTSLTNFQHDRGLIADGIAGKSALLALFPDNSPFEKFTGV